MNEFGLFGQPDGDAGLRVYGVAIGVVKSNKLDSLARLEVILPGLSGDKVRHPARIATLMAGKERGTFFLPQVDDEVLVAFECGDFNRPYILGALWNGKDNPPDTNENKENNLRFIKSRSGHLVRFDDTKDKEKIEIIDKSGKNVITIDTANNTVTIKSDKDINIEAAQGIIKLSAKTVEISSSAETKVEAKGGLTLEGKGNTNIKGQPVNIN